MKQSKANHMVKPVILCLTTFSALAVMTIAFTPWQRADAC